MTIRQKFLEHVGQTSPSPMMIEVAKADGIYLYNPSGKAYMDLVSGVSVSNVGHNNSFVVEAIQNQAAQFMHTMVYGETVMRPQVEYAQLLASLLPQNLNSVYFLNSGAEAIEGAIKLVKRHTGRSQIISMRNAYHGSTHGALSIQGDEFFKSAFRPLLPDCELINFNQIPDLMSITDKTAGVVCEVVQGESGINPAQKEWLIALRDRCNEVGAMLVFDEIQTGFGRCGSMFAFEKYGVVPDVLCLAKALGGGMPLGAFISSNEVMNDLTHSPVLGHITTFGGNPVCCAAGLAATKYIQENGLCEQAELMGKIFENRLNSHEKVLEIRRSGLLIAVELGSSQNMYNAIELMTSEGYMSDWFLFCDTAFRISPPLIISEAEVNSCCDGLLSILDRI